MIGILTDPETGDLQIGGRSLILGHTAEQTAEFVVMAARGEFKEHPAIGAEVAKLINGNIDPMWCANARKMLQACNLPVKRVYVKENQIIIA